MIKCYSIPLKTFKFFFIDKNPQIRSKNPRESFEENILKDHRNTKKTTLRVTRTRGGESFLKNDFFIIIKGKLFCAVFYATNKGTKKIFFCSQGKV